MGESIERIDSWWSSLFGIDDERLWRAVTVHPHSVLGDYAGWYVAWRDSGVHVSAPRSAATAEVMSLATETAPDLQQTGFWRMFAEQRSRCLMGPAIHFYLDVDPGPVAGVVGLADVGTVRGSVTDEEWVEAGMAHDPPPPLAFAVVEDGRPIALAVLNEWDGRPCDVGVLVVPEHRGRGLAEAVGQHAASYAVRESGLVRWRASTANVASVRAARRLGFEPWATQLAVRP